MRSVASCNSPELYNWPGCDAHLAQDDLVLHFAIALDDDPAGAERLAFADIVNQLDLTGLATEDRVDRERISRARRSADSPDRSMPG